ncbi:hypothetical protein QMK61_00270 [Fulvimonas sp. R45]|uniref:hypothetical protein n=1 Tax=Fulvimonas sp. R45 TaxID=3045937 RepID=UPI00265E7615|nr:hypothetical protein [Fulvimonas sp. R45]MDO1527255.1 hypothetical protein [Fulvimonas sp. R45]
MPRPPADRPHGTADRNQDEAVRMDVRNAREQGRTLGDQLPVDAEKVPGNRKDLPEPGPGHGRRGSATRNGAD